MTMGPGGQAVFNTGRILGRNIALPNLLTRSGKLGKPVAEMTTSELRELIRRAEQSMGDIPLTRKGLFTRRNSSKYGRVLDSEIAAQHELLYRTGEGYIPKSTK